MGRRYGGYEDALFEQRMLDVIERHEPTQPLFLFWAPHSVHTPYEVPKPFMERFDFIAGEHDCLQPTLLAGLRFNSDGTGVSDTPVGDTVPTADRQRCEMPARSRFACTRVGTLEKRPKIPSEMAKFHLQIVESRLEFQLKILPPRSQTLR